MEQVQLIGKLKIQAILEVKTGLHIGGSSDYAPIGAVDSVFVRDPLTKEPMIPGSSVKGKMRTLLAKVRNGSSIAKRPDEDEAVVLRLFGSAKKTTFSCLVCSLSIPLLTKMRKHAFLPQIQTPIWGK